MSKKKILSILIISLMVLGSVLFVVKSLHADCSDDFADCVIWCGDNNASLSAIQACRGVCLARFANCPEK